MSKNPYLEEQIQIDEVSAKLLRSYLKGAKKEMPTKIAATFFKSKESPEHKALEKREKGVATARRKLQPTIDKETKAEHERIAAHIKANPSPKPKEQGFGPNRGYGQGRYMGDSVEYDVNPYDSQQLDELKSSTLMSYLNKVHDDSQKHEKDPTKRSAEKRNKSVSGFARAFNKLEARPQNEEWVQTGKTATHTKTGQKTFEWAKVDKEGKRTGERCYRNAKGEMMGEAAEKCPVCNHSPCQCEDSHGLVKKSSAKKMNEEKKGLYYYVNRRKKAGTSRSKNHPDAPSAQDWADAAKTAKNESVQEDWQKVNKADNTDGMSQKAVNAYRRENPGSKLKTAVTEKNPTGKRKSRRASFCARMSGMKRSRASAETKRDPDSPINKALRRWNCNEETMQEEKDYSKPIAKLKDMISSLHKEVKTVSKSHEKMRKKEEKEHQNKKIEDAVMKEKDKAVERPTPDDHKAALSHMASQYRTAKASGNEDAANDAARNYHDYSNRLTDIYQRKLKESSNPYNSLVKE